MDTGSNRLLMAVNVESIAEVKVLVSSYQAEYGRSSGLQITAVTKSGTNRLPRIALRRRAQLRLERQQQGEHPQRRSEDGLEAARMGLFDRRTDRQARRQQQAVLLLRARVPAAHRRQQRAALPRCRRCSSGRVTFRRRPTTTGNPYALIRDALDEPAVHRDRYARLLPGRRHRRHASRRAACISPGSTSCGSFPLPNIDAAPGRELQLRDHQADREPAGVSARDPSRLSANPEAARDRQVHRAGGSDSRRSTARSRASTTRACRTPWSTWSSTTINYNLSPTMFLEGTCGLERQRAGGVRADGRAATSAPRALPMNRECQPHQRGPWQPALHLSRRQHPQPGLLRLRRVERRAAADLGRHPHSAAARLHLGRPHRQRAAEHAVPGLPERQSHAGTCRSA